MENGGVDGQTTQVPAGEMQDLVDEHTRKKIESYAKRFKEARQEIGKVVIGQHDMVGLLLEALITNGHVLIEGVPGIGKTLLVRTLSKIIGCSYSRIQFTPDLLPTDIVGVTTYEEGKGFFTIKGPVFSNFVLGDEINRSPPKVQSALLQSMQERQATIGKETFDLPSPFFVMATQNPVENLGTYKLPEAQLDRFIFKLMMEYPNIDEEENILDNNMSLQNFDSFDVHSIFNPDEIIEIQGIARKIHMDDKIKRYIVRLIDATRFPQKYNLDLASKYVNFGASPRGSISLFIASKVRALTSGRWYVTHKDVKDLAVHVLRHRILLNFEGEAEGINTASIVKEITDNVPLL
ncbi:MAG: AAA family ATPase [Candidatus Woesearchaeota archaeon]